MRNVVFTLNNNTFLAKTEGSIPKREKMAINNVHSYTFILMYIRKK